MNPDALPRKITLTETNFQLPGQSWVYKGKVRDVYRVGDYIILVASDRISAFDHILPRAIPFKGQVLNQIAAHFLKSTADIVPNWLLDTPDPNVAIGRYCEPIRLEMVIRGYLVGHAWRTYRSGERVLCGVTMPEGMRENDPFPEPIITPTTKEEAGHDIDISAEEILSRKTGLHPVNGKRYATTPGRSFKKARRWPEKKVCFWPIQKYEFGISNGQMMIMDEIHTPDSSRYFLADGFEERQELGQPQRQLSKEFVREWLIDHGFQGLEDQVMPIMSDGFCGPGQHALYRTIRKNHRPSFRTGDASSACRKSGSGHSHLVGLARLISVHVIL
jgi:phosphoribosylaminoimidazole-succinocarboxamide synthase